MFFKPGVALDFRLRQRKLRLLVAGFGAETLGSGLSLRHGLINQRKNENLVLICWHY